MDTPGFKDAYASVLEAFVENREEQYLAKAADLGREMVRAGVPPEDIAEIHEEALKRLAEKAADKTLLEFVQRISAPLMEMLMAYGLAFREREDERRRAQEQLEEGHAQLQRMLHGTLEVVQQATEARDPYTAGHQRRVAELSTAIARQMGLPEETCVSLVDMTARVHDIGKAAVPAEILSKPRKLNDSEFALVKTHPQVGYDILKSAELPYPVAEAVLQHHERLDGSGYPQGLSGDDILPEAQILAVADVVEAMSSHRPYRPALGIEAALEEVSSGSGIRYDPDTVAACLAVFRQEGFTFSSRSLSD